MTSDHADARAARLASAREEFDAKQARVSAEVSAYSRWELDEETATLAFFREDGASRTYSVIPIGTWLVDELNWAWAWANEAFPESSRRRSEALRTFDDPSGHARFTQPSFPARAEDVGELCVLAVQHLGGHAQFRTMGDLRAYYVVYPR
jgi:hypothetical protein